jgi:hypothetical protein
MLTQTPGEDAGARTRRTEDKNWPVYRILHCGSIVLLAGYSGDCPLCIPA